MLESAHACCSPHVDSWDMVVARMSRAWGVHASHNDRSFGHFAAFVTWHMTKSMRLSRHNTCSCCCGALHCYHADVSLHGEIVALEKASQEMRCNFLQDVVLGLCTGAEALFGQEAVDKAMLALLNSLTTGSRPLPAEGLTWVSWPPPSHVFYFAVFVLCDIMLELLF